MRQYIRHPTDIPLEYHLVDIVAHEKNFLKNISEGGLSFQSTVCIEPGAMIHITIPLRDPVFETEGIVVWCRESEGQFEVGVQFKDPSSEFRVRMIEQVCQIEHYKTEILNKEGRKLTSAEAAREWIAKYAQHFPQ